MATNYEKYFGTPEKVLSSIKKMNEVFSDQCMIRVFANARCKKCPASISDDDMCDEQNIEWLQEECDE